MSLNRVFILTVLLVVRIYAEDIQLVTTELGKNVSLHCTNRTWSEIMFETWKIRNTNGAECQIALRFDQTDANSTCEDRITIQNTSENRPFLHLSHFNNADEGNYTCNSAYNGGMDIVQFNVSIIDNGTKPPAESGHANFNWIDLLIRSSCYLVFIVIVLLIWKQKQISDLAWFRRTPRTEVHN